MRIVKIFPKNNDFSIGDDAIFEFVNNNPHNGHEINEARDNYDKRKFHDHVPEPPIPIPPPPGPFPRRKLSIESVTFSAEVRTLKIEIVVEERDILGWKHIQLFDPSGKFENVKVIRHEFDRHVNGSPLLKLWGILTQHSKLQGRMGVQLELSSHLLGNQTVRRSEAFFIEVKHSSSQRKKRKLEETNRSTFKPEILLITPSSGPTSGHTIVEILISISEFEYFGQLSKLKNFHEFSLVQFGHQVAPIIILNHWEDIQVRHEHFKGMLGEVNFEKVNFVLMVQSPPSQQEGHVDVYVRGIPEPGGFVYTSKEGGRKESNVVMMMQDNNLPYLTDFNLGMLGEDDDDDDDDDGIVEVIDFDIFNEIGEEVMDLFERTYLFYAIGKGDLRMMKYLLEKGCNPNHMDICGYRPIDVARNIGNKEIERLLLEEPRVSRKFVDDNKNEKKEEEEKERDERKGKGVGTWKFKCAKNCDRGVSFEDGKITHCCPLTSVDIKHENVPLEKFKKIVHITNINDEEVGKKFHKVKDPEKFFKEGVCSCKDCEDPILKGDVVAGVGKNSIHVEGNFDLT